MYPINRNKLMHLDLWELFFSVMETGSIAQVAIERNMERSQVSRMIATLESDLGHMLLTRSGRRIVPTQAALEAKRTIEPIIREMSTTLDVLTASTESDSGSIRFGAMPGFMQTQIVPLLVEFQKSHPAISFDVIAEDDPKHFMNGQTDLMLYYGPVHKQHLVEHWVTRSAFIPCASPKYLANFPCPPQCPEDLSKHAGIIYTGHVRPHSETLEFAGNTLHYKFKSQIRFNNILSVKAAALAGGGIALDMPLHHVYEEIVSGQLVPILGGWHVPNLDNYIASTVEAARLKRVKIFIDWYLKRRREIENAQKQRIQQRWGVLF